jgi:hypothetical protein
MLVGWIKDIRLPDNRAGAELRAISSRPRRSRVRWTSFAFCLRR